MQKCGSGQGLAGFWRKGEPVKNIFIEGLQGMGKSTLLQAISQKAPEYHVCREGDYSPFELAWCTWMTEKEYRKSLQKFQSLRKEISMHTFREGEHYIVTYTKILTDAAGFHQYFGEYEIYNGRKPLRELEEIILSRYRKYTGTGCLTECAFMQNIMEELILFQQLDDDEILSFYERLYDAAACRDSFLLLYLYSGNIAENLEIIRRERSDAQGNQLWHDLMMSYLASSPYGRKHGYTGPEHLMQHLRHRQQLELRVINEILKGRAAVLPAKQWEPGEVFRLIKTK